ncbi:receptor-binding cancer antigen expressed on siso cell [Holotrichia oblita]|uniref:Receptor-binding cancer antigen expressed on siso cell n=1 Tax=Holotrichia oblita TaxID=644536 RepID=A0ACB9SY37_HOLOL|nr:receptor-binding cancer antigen expressed on siso cell [Holotrichia oblita]
MFGMIIINKMRSFLLFFITLFRRALCCFRRRRRLSYVEPLTDIGIIANKQHDGEVENWNNWGNDGFLNKKPSTVQEHIDFYRQQKAQIQTQDEVAEERTDFFEDMTPKITAQKKVLIGSNKKYERSNNLSLVPDMVLTGNELGEWDENSGWDGEKLEYEAMEAIKEKKRIDRERKALEQQQRRMERFTNIKVNA